MKKMLIIAGSIVFLTAFVFFSGYMAGSKSADKVIPDRKASKKDSTITAEQEKQIAQKDSIIAEKSRKLIITTAYLKQIDKTNILLKTINDSLQEAYFERKTIQRCDSVITACNNYSKSLETRIDSSNMIISDFIIIVEKQKENLQSKDTVITSKTNHITALESQIGKINCMADWTSRHRFWSWLLGIKCR